jgi:hypothetical protein
MSATINIGIPDTTVCDKVTYAGQWFFLGILVSSTNKTDRHNDIAELLLKVALNTINQSHHLALLSPVIH